MKLSYEEKKDLPKKDFAEKKSRAYPIEDEAHARNALARVSEFGSQAEKETVKAKVHKKYPEIGESKELKEKKEKMAKKIK
jgi:hypothetical protein